MGSRRGHKADASTVNTSRSWPARRHKGCPIWWASPIRYLVGRGSNIRDGMGAVFCEPNPVCSSTCPRAGPAIRAGVSQMVTTQPGLGVAPADAVPDEFHQEDSVVAIDRHAIGVICLPRGSLEMPAFLYWQGLHVERCARGLLCWPTPCSRRWRSWAHHRSLRVVGQPIPLDPIDTNLPELRSSWRRRAWVIPNPEGSVRISSTGRACPLADPSAARQREVGHIGRVLGSSSQ